MDFSNGFGEGGENPFDLRPKRSRSISPGATSSRITIVHRCSKKLEAVAGERADFASR